MDIYEKIEELCREKGTTITAMERAVGFSRGSVGKLKKGVKTSPERLQKIAEYFGVSVASLIGEPETAFSVSGSAAETVRKAVSDPAVWRLLSEAVKATPGDVATVTDVLTRLNSYANGDK